MLNEIEATDKEVFQLLKQVRRDFSYLEQLSLWAIARNDTLELLARKRPHNLNALKNVIKDFPNREKNKLDKYWEIFVDRLKYLHKEELIIENNQKIQRESFFKRLFKN